MDIFEIEKMHNDNENEIELSTNQDMEVFRKELENQARVRRLEIAKWAEEKSIVQGVPNIEKLNKVWNKLKKGKSIIKAINGICSYNTWCKWRKEYPEIAAMEENARQERIDKLQEEIKSIADQPDRTRMGETARDKLMIEARQQEIDRQDRLTQNRNNVSSNGGNIVPIQINVKYGKDEEGE